MIAVPNSAGTTRPRYTAPANTCDCHIHIYDPRFPMVAPELRGTPDASAREYRLLQQRLGTSRTVVVQPAAYGTDNRVTVAAIGELGAERTRGVAVVHPKVSDAELRALDAGGVRGIRFSQHEPKTAMTTREMIEPLAARVGELGWHVQLHLRGMQIVDMAALIAKLPCTVVIDHMGRAPQPEGARHESVGVVLRLLDNGRTWVKISGPYLDTRTGSPRYADVDPVARRLIAHAPQRCVWGSDWPHPTEPVAKPDDAVLFDLVREWAGDEATWRRVLVDNPAALYGFPKE